MRNQGVKCNLKNHPASYGSLFSLVSESLASKLRSEEVFMPMQYILFYYSFIANLSKKNPKKTKPKPKNNASYMTGTIWGLIYYYCLKLPLGQTAPDPPSLLPEPTCPYTSHLLFITQKHESGLTRKSHLLHSREH